MTIGYLCYGDLFRFDGKIYKVGRIIRGTDGYVACTEIETKKVKRFYIDTDVEKVEKDGRKEQKCMPEYHVGCGIAGIYAGILKANEQEWKSKSCVTTEALNAVAQYLLDNGKALRFSCCGKNYVLAVNELVGEQEGKEDK